MPPACSITDLQLVDEDGNSRPLAPGTIFDIFPEQAEFLAVSVSCDSTLSQDSPVGQLAATVTSADASNPGIIVQSFVRTVVPVNCDVNADGSVDSIDINDIMERRGALVAPGSLYDVDADGLITVNDARVCSLQCSLPLCAVPRPQ